MSTSTASPPSARSRSTLRRTAARTRRCRRTRAAPARGTPKRNVRARRSRAAPASGLRANMHRAASKFARHLAHARGVLGGEREDRHAVERAAGRHHAAHAEQPERGLVADEIVERRGHAARAGGVGAEREAGEPERHRHRRAARGTAADVSADRTHCGTRRRASACPPGRWRTDRDWSCRARSRRRRAAAARRSRSSPGCRRTPGRPAVVGSPARSMLSLIANGMPYSGSDSGSTSRARARARAAPRRSTALIQMLCARCSRRSTAASRPAPAVSARRSIRAAQGADREIEAHALVARVAATSSSVSPALRGATRGCSESTRTVPAHVGEHGDFHLHRLQDHQLVARFDALAGLDLICQTLPVTGDVTATQSSGSSGATRRAAAFSTAVSRRAPAARQRSRSASKAPRWRVGETRRWSRAARRGSAR